MCVRSLVVVSVTGTLAFVVCAAVAIALYPGGTWYEPSSVGHSFAYNFLCDLMQLRALNGMDNVAGSIVAQVGMVFMIAAIAAFFVQVARYGSPDGRAQQLTRRAGVLSCVLGCAVPIVRADWFHEAHLVVVVSAVLPALVAITAALIVCLRTAGVPWWLRGLAILTLATAAADFALYGLGYAVVWGLVPSFPLRLLNLSLPVIQRVATLAMLAWVLATSVHTYLSIATGSQDLTPTR